VWHIKKLIKEHDHYTGAPLKCAVLSHNTMPKMSQVLREYGIGMLTAGMSTRAVARQLNVNFSTKFVLENLAVCPTGLTNADHVYGVVCASGLLMSTFVNTVPNGFGGVMVWAGMSY
jgi:hypothetical protein